MRRYVIDGGASRVVVSARSSIHDTTTRWTALAGAVEADPAALASGATADVAVDMTRYDAGDFLKNRKLRKDLALARHPEARFSLDRLRDVVDQGGGRFTAVAEGAIAWRGRSVAVVASGQGEVDERVLRASGSFELDVRDFGVEPPRFLMFKVENVVTVEVVLVAARAPQA